MTKRVLLAVLLGMLAAPAIRAQDTEFRRFIEEERRQKLDAYQQRENETGRWYVDLGGWERMTFFRFNDQPTNPTRKLYDFDTRYWIDAGKGAGQEFYLRGRTIYDHYSRGDSYDGDDRVLHKGRLDQGFYRIDVDKVTTLPMRLRAQAGRQYMYLGSGLAYSQVNDGAELTLGLPKFDVKVLGGRTLPTQENVDASVPGATETERWFLGVEATATAFDKCAPYVFFLLQRDQSDEQPDDTTQDYRYQSRYLGIGARGEIIHNLAYRAEIVSEFGTSAGSFTVPVSTRERIRAFAFDGKIEYFWDRRMEPKFSLEMAVGSGDSDRASVTDTLGGNTAETSDNNFLGFGYTFTGYSLAPLLSNLWMARAGASFKPLSDHRIRFLRTLELGTEFFAFWKQKKNGGISDSRADLPNRFLGMEPDVFLNWNILSDLALDSRFGIFYPDDAYSLKKNRTYFSLGLTYSF